MFSLLLAAANPVEHAAAAGGSPADLLVQFGVEGKYVVWQLVSFAILAFVLYKFAIKPVLATMDERTSKIEAGLKYAEDMRNQLATSQQESAAIVKNAQLEANKIVEAARKTAKEFSDKQTQEATERGNALIVKAQQAIELEHKKMLAEARTEIARLVVTTTQRVLSKELSDSERARYNDAAARELTSV